MIVYGSVLSPFVRKLLGYLGEKGIGFELKGVGIGDPDPGFRAASPLGKMPAIDDDGYRLADSSAIIHYLEAKHPEPELIPADPQLRGRTIWWEEFGDTLLAACSGKLFFNRVVAPHVLKREGDLAAAAQAEAGRPAEAARLSGGGDPRERLSGRRPADARRPCRRLSAGERPPLQRRGRSGALSEDRGVERGDPLASQPRPVDREGRADDGGAGRIARRAVRRRINAPCRSPTPPVRRGRAGAAG